MPQERDFPKRIIALSNKALDVMEKYLDGQVLDGKLVQYAERMISAGIKFSIRDQLDEQAKRQQALPCHLGAPGTTPGIHFTDISACEAVPALKTGDKNSGGKLNRRIRSQLALSEKVR